MKNKAHTILEYLKTVVKKAAGSALAIQDICSFDLGTDWATLSVFETGEYLEVNDAFLEFTGLSRNEVIGRTSLELGIWARPADRQAMLDELRSKGRVINAEFRFRTKSGRELVMLRSSRLIKDGRRRCIYSVNRDITELRSAEQHLAKLSLAVEQSPSSVIITDGNGTIEYVNPAYEKLTGYHKAELIGQNPRVVKSGHHSDEFYRDMWGALTAGREVRCEMLNKKKNGDLFWESASISPLRNKNGEITHYIGIKEDITERKRLEDALATSEAYLRKLLDNAADAVFVVGTESAGPILDANQAAYESLGYAREEMLRLSLPDIVAEFSPARRQDIASQLYRQKSLTIETRHRRKDGTQFPVEVRLGLLETGETKVIVAIARDITERKEAEIALQVSEAKFRSYVENAPMAVFVTDSRGRYVDCNPAAVKLLGYEAGVLSGMSIAGIVPEEDRPVRLRDFADLVQRGRWEGEVRLESSDGRIFWASLRAVRLTEDRYLAFCRDITERKHALDKIKQLVNEQQTILNTVPIGIAFVKDRKIEWANAAFDRMFGYELEETRGKDTLSFYADPAAYAQLGDKGYSKLLSGEIFRSEEEMIRKDGLRLFCNLTGCAVNPESSTDGSIWILEDNTDRKKAELALQKSRLDLLAILNNLPFHAWLKDTEGRLLAVNQPFAQLVGRFSPEEVVGKTDYDLWPPSLAQGYRTDDQEVIRTRKQKAIEEQVPGQAGLRWFETYKSPLFDTSGTVTGTTGFSRDITDRKRAEEHLLKRVNFESAIAAISGDFAGKSGSTLDDGIRKALRIIGRTVKADRSYLFTINGNVMDNTYEWSEDGMPSEIENLQRISPDSFPWIMGRLRRFETVSVARMQDLPPEAENERREFLRASIKSVISVPVVGGGRLHGFIGFDAVRQEREWSLDDIRLIQIVAGLFASVIERKQAEDDILRARDAAQVANRAKSQFLANISHEIRTPMNAILGLTDLVLDSQLEERQRMNLETVRQSAYNLLTMLNQLLDLSKIEAGKMEMHETRFNLAAALDGALMPFRLQARQKGILLSYEIGRSVPRDLEGDVGFLRQVITNLVGNAVKFADHGEISLVVQSEGISMDDGKSILRFAVSDRGIGIAPDKLETIFESFTQADGSVTRKYGGTGLGLAISKRLVGLLGGRIWAASVPGSGSTFSFTAAFAKKPSSSSVSKTSSYTPHASSGRRFGAFRVLLAEDNAGNQELVRQVLMKRGHGVSVAGNGQEVLALLETETFDLILMDIQMPEMDGVEALRKIRENECLSGTRRVPVIALTAHAFESDRERFLNAGFDGYLPKPFSVIDLTRVVEEKASCPCEAGIPAPPEQEEQGYTSTLPVNIDEALERLEGDREILDNILNVYLRETPELVLSLERALQRQSAEDAERFAHSIKSVSANIGAGRMAGVASEIERMARNRTLGITGDSLEKLKQELHVVLAFIRRLPESSQ
jgi:PAS domain S-box-containing protein